MPTTPPKIQNALRREIASILSLMGSFLCCVDRLLANSSAFDAFDLGQLPTVPDACVARPGARRAGLGSQDNARTHGLPRRERVEKSPRVVGASREETDLRAEITDPPRTTTRYTDPVTHIFDLCQVEKYSGVSLGSSDDGRVGQRCWRSGGFGPP
jgi:hypothetical protein